MRVDALAAACPLPWPGRDAAGAPWDPLALPGRDGRAGAGAGGKLAGACGAGYDAATVGLADPAGDPPNPGTTSASAGAASAAGDAQLAGTVAPLGLALPTLSHGELASYEEPLSYEEPPLSHDAAPFPFEEALLAWAELPLV